MKLIKYILIMVMIINFYSCGNSEKKESVDTLSDLATETEIKLTKEQFESNNMEIETLQNKSFSMIVQSNGMIDVPPANKAIVNALMGGYIKITPLLIGDSVKKGQVLVTIENNEFVVLQQEYLEIKEQLTYLESEFNRQKTLFDEKITSQKKYLKAESDFKASQAKYKGLKKQLQMLNISLENAESGNFTSIATIYSPISGSITKVNVSIGTFVSPATQIMEIIDNSHLHLELAVFEKDILKLKKGQEINFKIPEASTETFKAEVHLIGTSINENRTIKVHGHLEDELQKDLLVGMFVEANIITESKFLKALPEDAVVELEGKFYALLLTSSNNEGMNFNQVEITIGDTFGGYTEIKNSSDFSETDKFLTKGVFNLLGE